MKKFLILISIVAASMFSTVMAAVGDVTTIVNQTFNASTTLTDTGDYTWGPEISGMVTANGVYVTNASNKANNYENRDFLTFTSPVGSSTKEVGITYEVYSPRDKGQNNTYYDINYFNADGKFVFGIQEASGVWEYTANVITANEDGTTTTTALPAGHMKKGGGSVVNVTVKFSGTKAIVSIDGENYTAYTISEGIKSVKLSVTGENGYDRDMYIKNYVLKTTEVAAAQFADYTLDYVVDGSTIKTETNSGEVGTAISLTASEKGDFTLDGKKYIYVSDDAEGKTIAADGTTKVTLTYREAYTFNYTVKNNVNDIVKTGSVLEGESATVAYSRYILADDGVVWEKDAINKEYNYTFTPSSDNFEANLDYTKTTISDGIFFKEAEDMDGMTVATGSNANVRCSNSAGGYAEGSVTLHTLNPGTYKIKIGVWGNNGATFTIKANDETVLEATTNGSWHEATSEAFTLNAETALTFEGADSSKPLDYLLITGKEADLTAKPYKIEYKVDGVVIKTVERSGTPGTPVTLTEDDMKDFSITEDGVTSRYIYVSNDAEGMTISEDGTTVVTLTYRKAETYNYTVNAYGPDGNLLGEISTGSDFENENVTYYYPEYYLDKTSKILYSIKNNSTNPYFGATGSLDNQATEFKVNYTGATVENVVFYKEAEEMEGFKSINGNNAPIRCSNGLGGNVENGGEVLLTTLPAGKYKIHGQVWGTANLTAGVKIKAVDGGEDTNLWSLASTGSLKPSDSDEFTLGTETELYVYTTGGTDNRMLDLIYIQKTGDVINVSSVTLDKTEAEVEVGKEIQLNVTYQPENAENAKFAWSSTDDEIATVDQNGVVTGKAVGNCVITVAVENDLEINAVCSITVKEPTVPVTDIVIKGQEGADAPTELTVGDEYTLVAEVAPENATDKTVTWQSSDETIATVDDNGKVTAVAPGKVTISATAGEKTAECTITVKAKVIAVTGVSLNITETEVVEGTTVQLEATVEPETATDKTVTWTSSDEAVATVDENGLVTTKAPGTATITATAGEAKATCVITVTAKPIEVEGIELKTKEATVAEGAEFKIEYVINPENATDKTVTWTSSNGEVATVDNEGNVTAVAAGEATISAKAGEYTDKCLVIVKKNVAGVKLNMSVASINIGETIQINAEIDPEDAIVTTVTWSSSDEKVATVDETGLVTGVGGGNADIIATAGEKSAKCNVTVIVPVTGLSVLDEDHNPLESGVTIPLHTGDNYNLTAVVTPENATDPTVIWTSSDTEVAEVDEEGLIETHKAGEATITAKIGEFSFEAKVVVTDPVIPITGISLDKTEAEMLTGDKLTLTVKIEPEDASSKEVGWKSSNTAIATVDKKGVVTALKAGEVTITASANKLTATCKITIKDPVIPVTGISLDEIKIDELIEGKTVQLTATVAPENATDKTVVWSSDNEDVATVDQTGLVTAVAPGTANITATAGEAKATCEITVIAKPIAVEGIELNEKEVTLVEGAVFELGYTINPETATDKTVTWTSSDEAVATVDSEGKVTAVAVGEAVITAKAGDKTAECNFIVKKAVAAVTLDQTEATIKVDETLQLTATIVPENAIVTKVTWTSDNEEVATVDENGLVTAIATGEAVITAEAGKMTATCKITVEPAVIAVTGVKLDVLEIDELMEGETVQLTATVEPDDATDKTVTWSSDNEEVATVDQNGLVTAVAPGTVIITATAGEASATCKITVAAKPIAVEGIELNEKEVTLDVGAVFTIKYTIDPENATDKTVTWTSSDEKVATVDAKGNVTAVAVGEAVITAKAGDKTATCKFIVEPAGIKVSEVTINLTEATIGVDELLYLEAIVTPADAIDAALTWTSSNEKVAKVDANGVVTAIAPGVAIITAKAGKKSAECKLTVEKSSGVEQIGFDPEAPIQVYNLSGLYVSDSIKYLKPGYYIIRQGDNVKKVFIK